MSYEQAKRILDKILDGVSFPLSTVNMALFLVGEIEESDLEKFSLRAADEFKSNA